MKKIIIGIVIAIVVLVAAKGYGDMKYRQGYYDGNVDRAEMYGDCIIE